MQNMRFLDCGIIVSLSGMAWCSEWLRDWLRNYGRSQADLAVLANVAPGNVSRWLSGHTRPDRDALVTMVRKLSRNEASSLLVAWLRDQLPEGLERLVDIQPRAGGSQQPPLADAAEDLHGFPAGMSDDLRERLLFFGRLAVVNPDMRNILDVCYQAAKQNIR